MIIWGGQDFQERNSLFGGKWLRGYLSRSHAEGEHFWFKRKTKINVCVQDLKFHI